jgi:aldose 1-epimerase
MRGMKNPAGLLLVALLVTGVSAENPRISATTTSSVFGAQRISVDGVPVVRLKDDARGIEVSVLPSIGNIAYEMKVHGKNILYFPEANLAEFQKKPMQIGIPFMAPWANRLDGDGFWAGGTRYSFDTALGNYSKDGHGLPIHGLLGSSMVWRVTAIGADNESAQVTSKLEFWKYPNLMAQWPFAHEYEMTYRLSDGALEVKTSVSNLSGEAMPLAVGYHPYFTIPDVSRDQWVLHLPARKAVLTDDRLIPTGELKEVDLWLTTSGDNAPANLPGILPLKGLTLDHGFTDLQRDAKGRARFLIDAGEKKIEILFGPRYPVAVIWKPAFPSDPAAGFICIEPMTGVTNAVNLHHAGKYPDLQMVPANGKWTESFWIRATGI